MSGKVLPPELPHRLWVSWLDAEDRPATWPPVDTVLGYWNEGVEDISEEGKDTPTTVHRMFALVGSSDRVGPGGLRELLTSSGWCPIGAVTVQSKSDRWTPDPKRYPRPLWSKALERDW